MGVRAAPYWARLGSPILVKTTFREFATEEELFFITIFLSSEPHKR